MPEKQFEIEAGSDGVRVLSSVVTPTDHDIDEHLRYWRGCYPNTSDAVLIRFLLRDDIVSRETIRQLASKVRKLEGKQGVAKMVDKTRHVETYQIQDGEGDDELSVALDPIPGNDISRYAAQLSREHGGNKFHEACKQSLRYFQGCKKLFAQIRDLRKRLSGESKAVSDSSYSPEVYDDRAKALRDEYVTTLGDGALIHACKRYLQEQDAVVALRKDSASFRARIKELEGREEDTDATDGFYFGIAVKMLSEGGLTEAVRSRVSAEGGDTEAALRQAVTECNAGRQAVTALRQQIQVEGGIPDGNTERMLRERIEELESRTPDENLKAQYDIIMQKADDQQRELDDMLQRFDPLTSKLHDMESALSNLLRPVVGQVLSDVLRKGVE